jgi:hypothetical protein
MKKIIIVSLLIVASAHFAFAQNNLKAKLKYEEAEEAYSLNNYELALSNLKEAESLLGTTNPKILYLKISTQSKLINSNPYNDFALLENARKLSAKYLKDYESLAGNEEKYRDIYKIENVLNSYPATLREFEAKKIKMADAAAVQKTEALNNVKKADENFMNYVYFKNYKIGLTLEETLKLYPGYKKHYTQKLENGSSITAKKQLGIGNPDGFYVKNGKVFGYYYSFYSASYVDDANYSNAMKKVNSILTELNTQFLFTPTETITESSSKVSRQPFYTKAITYEWKKNGKTITLYLGKSTYMGENLSALFISSMDENLAK